MSISDIQAAVATVSAALAVLVSAGTVRGRGNDRAAALARMEADIAYIKERIDHHIQFDHRRREDL